MLNRLRIRFKNSAPEKTVVMACTQPYWSALQVGSQHLARQFAAHGWTVHYFSAPVTPLHLFQLFSPEVTTRLRLAMRGSSIHENGKIHAHIPCAMISPDGRPILREELVTRHWYRTMIPSFQWFQKKTGMSRATLLYIDNLSYAFFLDHFAFEKSVFRVMDLHERFHGWKGKTGSIARDIARKSDLTVYSAHSLKAYADALGARKSVFMPNGVDFDFFHSCHLSAARHPAFNNVPEPILLYTGMIDSRVDMELIRWAAGRLPEVSFVFAGPVESPLFRDNIPENIYFIGPVPHEHLPWLMQSAAAGLIPFDVKNQLQRIQSILPLKLFEYMASGLPVIAARWPEVERLDSPAWLYENKREFLDFVYQAIAGQYDPSVSQEFAGHHDWKSSFEILLENLNAL